MGRKVAGFVGALAALAVTDSSQAAAPAPVNLDAVMQVSSYADLLKPIANATTLLKASDEAEAQAALMGSGSDETATVQEAQYYYHDHHHHHHNRYYRRFYHHHHHHHDYYRRRHHHHHHHRFRNEY